MNFEEWEKKPETIGVATYDSAQPYDGPGRVLMDPDTGEKFLFTPEGERYGPLLDGDYITLRRGIVGYQAKDKLEGLYRPVPSEPSEPEVT